MSLLCFVLLTAVSLGWGHPAQSQTTPTDTTPRPLRVEDMFRFASVRSPVVSPDGRRVAYVVSTTDLEENSSRSHVWMLDLPDGEPRRMTGDASSASSPAFSPDGRWLTFLTSRDDEPTQVWAMDLRGGEATALTDVDAGVNDYAWSPDSQRLALLVRDEAPEREDGELRPPWVIDRLQFKQDYRGYLDRRRTHVYTYQLDSKRLRRVTSGDYDHADLAWSPDGRRLAFTSNRTPEPDANYDTDVWIVELEGELGTDSVPTPTRISRGTAADDSPKWSPDGTTLAWTTRVDPDASVYALSHLAVAAPGEEPRVLSEHLDRNVWRHSFSDDGEQLFALVEDEGEQRLHAFPLDASEPRTVAGGAQAVHDFAAVPSGGPAPPGSVVAQMSSPDQPSELWLVSGGGEPSRLTRHNDALVAEFTFGRVSSDWVTSPDGTRLEAFYTFPPGVGDSPDEPLPTILWIHGGPTSQDDVSWDALRQLFAAHGYLVVQPNYRGSHGYGQDFALGLWQNWGGPESMDAVAAVDHAIERGWADPERLGVGGWSYGAITTNAIITKTDRFGAAISGAGAALWVAAWGHDQYQRWYRYELGLPWENPDLWTRISPFYDVANITTPTLWMGGQHDWNVPIQQSEIMYQSMKSLGRETLLVVYPDQGHGGFPPVYEVDRYRRFLGWFGRHLLGDDSLWPEAQSEGGGPDR